MPHQTPFFQAFGPLLFGRPARAALERLSKLDSLQELYAIFGDLFPQRLLNPTEKGANKPFTLIDGTVVWGTCFKAGTRALLVEAEGYWV